MTNIKSALERRLVGAKKDEGFSLIELLVVVIIIGILAAIAIPIYIGVQNSAQDSATEADLANAKTAVVAYYTDNGTYPAAIDAATLSNYGLTGPVTDVSVASAITTFCLSAVSDSGATFYITANGSATETKPATCT